MKKKKNPIPLPQEGAMDPMDLFLTDPMGSYTGRPMLPEEEPVQDADDL